MDLLFIGRLRSNTRSLGPLLKLSIALWLWLCPNWNGSTSCFVISESLLLDRFLCTVAVRQLCILPLILSFMNERSTLKLIAMLFVMLFKLDSSLRTIVALNCNSPTFQPIHFHFLPCKLDICDLHALTWKRVLDRFFGIPWGYEDILGIF